MLGGGAGHIADMISRLKANRDQLKQKTHFKKKEENIYEGKHIELHFKEATEEEKKAIFLKISKEKKKQDLFDKVMLALFILLFIGSFSWFMMNYFF